MGRSPCCQKEGLKKGVWTPDEDQKLIDFIALHGHGNWRALPKRCGLLRCGKSCRLRWTNYLRPDIKRGQFSHSEEQKIIHLHALVGNKWAFIASQLPKRTDNEIKNYWNTVLKKRLPKMGLNNVMYQQKGLPDSVSTSDTKVSGSTLSHLAQWESARVEAEARLAKESNIRTKGVWVGVSVKTGSSAPSHIPPTPSKLQEARVLLQQSSSSVHPMSFASNVENSLQEQMNQMLRATSFSSSTSGSALSSDSFELRPAKSALYSAQDSHGPLKLASNGSLTWNSHELLSKDSAMSDFLRFSKLRPEKLDEGAESNPRHLLVREKGLQSVTKEEQLLTLDGSECHSFADLHELLFGDDSGSCLSPHSTTPWSQSSDGIIHVCSPDMEDNRESEATMTTSNLNLEEETPRYTMVESSTQIVQACRSSVKACAERQTGKPRPHNSVSKENEVPRDSLLPQYDSITEGNTSQWNTFFSQLLESPCSARPLGNSVTVGAGIAGF